MQVNRNNSLGSVTDAARQARAQANAGGTAAAGAAAGAPASGFVSDAVANAAWQARTQMDQFRKSENTQFQSARTKTATPGAGQATGFCGTLRPPNLNLPPLDVKGSVLKYEALQAKGKLDQTVKDATSDGHITAKERQNVNAAGRKLEIAEARVDLHEAGKAHKSAVADAVRDRRITPDEGKKINDAQQKIERLDAKLKGLEFWNRFEPSSDNPVIGPGGTREAQQPKLKGEPAAPGTRPGEMRPREAEQPAPKPFLERLKDLIFPALPEFPKPPVLEATPVFSGNLGQVGKHASAVLGSLGQVGKRASATGNVS